jgi:hypothetical protein
LASIGDIFPVAVVERGQAPGARGYLRRQADPDDGRCTQAVLTDAVTPAQLRQLRAANDRILARIDPEATTRPPPIEP